MKKRIVKLEVVDGVSINEHWSCEMYIINGRYLASSISEHNRSYNPKGWTFNFKLGEEADVATNHDSKGLKDSEGRVWEWIARIT